MRTSKRETVKLSKALRRVMTLPEVLLWRELRARPRGHKFRHQHGAGPYVLDFYCAAAALCIEVDGKAHEMGTNPARDERRDAWLAEQGIRTLRIPAEEILRDLEPVVILIEQECASRSPSTGYAGPPPRQKPGRISREHP
jgi:very-short-patch-repair endonuclease